MSHDDLALRIAGLRPGEANYDVSRVAFWLQELNTVLFRLLLSVVCFQWLRFAGTLSHMKPESHATLTSATGCVSDVFLRWRLTSLLVALSFFPFTTFYWDLVVHAKDTRFLPAAIILHTNPSVLRSSRHSCQNRVESAPVISLAGSPELILTVNGSDFLSPSVIEWNGAVVPTKGICNRCVAMKKCWHQGAARSEVGTWASSCESER